MLSAEYLKDPPEKEKILVEHSTKHTVVLKPGFYNRRNQSELLRKSFPAGFQVKSAVTDRLADASVRDTRFINPYGSFTDWTKGETDTLADSVSADLTDPYADVAGPYLTDILASRPAVQKTQLDVNKHSSVVATEVPLHNRSKKASKTKPKASSPSKPHVYNAPALLPTFTPALAQSKVVNNLVPANATAYDHWLAFQRSDLGEKFWQIKGNAEDYNYSSHEFNGGRSTASQLLAEAERNSLPPSPIQEVTSHLEELKTIYPTILTEIPKPLPPYVTIEVHTVNQLVRTDKVSEEKHIVRTIDSQLTLAELKALVTEEIISGIEKAFRLYPSDNNAHTHGRLDYSKVELSFQCFSPYAHAWRPVNNEVDWIQAKQSCRNEHNVLRVMYALEKKSEFMLLKEIQHSYQRQKDAERERAAPQISLKALTESMESELKMRKKYVFTDSPPNSPRRIGSSQSNRRPSHQSQSLRSPTSLHAHAPLSKSTSALPPPSAQPPTYFLPLGQNAATLAALSATKNSRGTTPESNRSGKRSGRQLEPLTRSSSGVLPAGPSVVSASSLLGVRTIAPTPIIPMDTTPKASQGSRSVFYPKRSDTLDKMYEQLESSMPRQQDFANNLEQRLFKTKW